MNDHVCRRGAFVAAVLLSLLALAVAGSAAENWPRWRGPKGGAVSAETGLPTRWSREEGVVWRTRVPAEGASSPIVWEDAVFLTSAADHGGVRVVTRLDRLSGRVVWRRAIIDENPEIASALTGHAAATPVTDGRHVVAMFGNAGVVCYDFDGAELWRRRLGEFDTEFGLASSPILHRNAVVLVCDHDGDRFGSFDSFLIALDVETGETRWRTARPGLERSWSTPIVVPTEEGRRELVVCAQDAVRGYDLDRGRELWRLTGLTGWVAPSPVFGEGLIYAVSGRNGPIVALRPGGRGDVTETHRRWSHSSGGSYVCSPLLYEQRLYVHDAAGILRCYDARSGARIFQQRLEGRFTASAVAGDGKLYFISDVGTTFVVAAGPQFELLAENPLEEETLASPAIHGGNLLIRTQQRLYCIGGAE